MGQSDKKLRRDVDNWWRVIVKENESQLHLVDPMDALQWQLVHQTIDHVLNRPGLSREDLEQIASFINAAHREDLAGQQSAVAKLMNKFTTRRRH